MANCLTGTLVYSTTGPFVNVSFDDVVSSDTPYFYRLCISDAAGNLTSSQTGDGLWQSD